MSQIELEKIGAELGESLPEKITQEDCFKAFMENPCQKNAEEYIAVVEQQAAKGYYRESRREFIEMLYRCAKNHNDSLYSTMESMRVRFSGHDAENRLIDMMKFLLSNRVGSKSAYIKLYLSKCIAPKYTQKQVRRRLAAKPVKKIWRMITQFFSKTKNFIYRQHQYYKYGYTRTTISAWKKIAATDSRLNSKKDQGVVNWAHKHGFLYARVEQYGLTEQNLHEFISDKDYLLLNPINNSYKKWIEDIPSLRYCLPEARQYFPKLYYHVLRRNKKPFFVRIDDCPEGYKGGDIEEVLRLIRNQGDLVLEPAAFASGARSYNLRYEEEQYYAGSEVVSEDYVRRILSNQSRFYVLREHIRMREDFSEINGRRVVELRATIINRQAFTPIISELCIRQTGDRVIQADPQTGSYEQEGMIPNWNQVREQLLTFCNTIPQLEYYAVYFRIAEDGIYVMSCNPHPDLLKGIKPSRETMDFLLEKVAKRRAARHTVFTKNRFKNRFWDMFRKRFCRPGYRDFMLREYVTGIVNDFLHFRKTSLKEKRWCYQRGFYSFRLDQYGLTEDNWRDILSDRDYHWLCPINNTYQKWIDDKMTYRQVIEPFAFISPKYYYHIMNREGVPYAISMRDCPKKYDSSFEGIMELLKEEGALAVKQSAGEHGDGFFKIAYRDGTYFINHDESSYEEILNKLRGLQRFYNVTEFLTMHEDLRQIYPGSVNTVRVMVLNPTGCDPYIANAYLRIGTGSTRMTDNIGYGGVFAKVDVESGRYYGAERLQDHIIVPCPNHPDTGVLIEGVLPDWEFAKKTLIDICNYFGQLEYLGFDVALSSQGVKILEINKYQDLHRCAFYGETVQNFFKEKIAEKKKQMNIQS